jgi:hypothetical protein
MDMVYFPSKSGIVVTVVGPPNQVSIIVDSPVGRIVPANDSAATPNLDPLAIG